MAGVSSQQKGKNMRGNTNPDRISSLPEPLLHHILSLSFITTKQAVQMSLLSKQWRHFWKSLPYLRFDNLNKYMMDMDYSKRKLVLLRDESNLHTFYLKERMGFCNIGEEDDDELIDLLITLQVQELHILHPLYISISAIIRLLNQKHIKSLELEHVIIWGEDLNKEKIISSSSVENLVLACKYKSIGSITIHAPKLKYLEFWNSHKWDYSVYNINIRAPALIQIHLYGNSGCDVHLENTSSLIDVKYDMSAIWANVNEHFRPFSNFLKVLVIAKSFTFDSSQLENHFLESPAEDLEYFWKPIQASVLNINYLEVQKWHTSLHIHTLAKFIEKFSSLVTLVLEGDQPYDNALAALVKNERDWDEQLAFECSFSKLKTVEITNIQGHENELIFIAFLLRSAPVLEKLNISINRSLFSRDELKYNEKLHSLPSYSPSVTISLRFT